jgi:hypothetical protein
MQNLSYQTRVNTVLPPTRAPMVFVWSKPISDP